METKFKNKTLIYKTVSMLWGTSSLAYFRDKCENGMCIEDIIAMDFIGREVIALKVFSNLYHYHLTIHNNTIRRKKHEL